MVENASPTTEPQSSPVKKWNWGAFFLNWIWGLGNSTPKALLCLIPVFGIAWMFVCGAKGDAWAWKNKKWKSPEHFRKVQRTWSWIGLAVWVLCIIIWGSTAYFIEKKLAATPPVKIVLVALNNDTRTTQRLGSPIIRNGWVKGSLHVNFNTSSASAELNFPVKGPLGKARVYLYATKKGDDEWQLKRVKLRKYKQIKPKK